MNPLKWRIPLSLVVAALGIAAGSGGTVAVAGARQDRLEAKANKNEQRIEMLEKESQANRERVLRIEILSEQTNKTVERIERKLDSP